MYLKNKRVLVLGLGISGLSTVEALNQLEARIIVSDIKTEEELKDFFDKTREIPMEKYLANRLPPLETIDLIIKSPGILPSNPIIMEARKRNIEVVTDIELAYRLARTENIIAITGTNGKTTTTALTGEIMKKAKFKTHIVGNIGLGILKDMIGAGEEDVFVVESSSFQLEDTIYFKPKISLITNITPDHLNWHASMDEYINAKKKVFRNQTSEDFTILNYDDLVLREISKEVKSKIIWFSVQNQLDRGICLEDDYIVAKDGDKIEKIMNYKDLKILGKHNLENALAGAAIGRAMGVETKLIEEGLREFPGVEHRTEYVTSIGQVAFYNDSKATNPDSTIKAIEALERPIILIAGGQEKAADYHGLIQSFKGKVKELILLGETKEKIKEAALDEKFTNTHLVHTMKEAVELAYKLSEESDNVLLSPACASWDMYPNFEERGKDFKSAVYGLGVD